MKLILSILCFSFFGFVSAQQRDYVDFKTGQIDIAIQLQDKQVHGVVSYEFEILKNSDSVFIDAKSMKFESILLNSEEIEIHYDGSKLWLLHDFKKLKHYKVSMRYSAFPKNAMYFIENDKGIVDQMWTQGQGKYTSHWLPSFDDMNEKVEYDITVQYDSQYEMIANGNPIASVSDVESPGAINFNMSKPMSSYLVALVIGNYRKKTEFSKSGIPLEYYYDPKDSTKVEPTYRYSKEMFDYLEAEIGVPYPWEIYKQVPVKDFLYSGMENTTLTIFSDALMTDSKGFKDRNYVNVNAHELAHQWFGNLVTETNGTHHWLQEGFATYYALLAERELFGEEYYYWRLYEYAQQLLEQEKAREATALLNPKSSSLTFYQKGCWALHVLKEKIGESAFKNAVKNYLLKYEYKNVATPDFITEVEQASGEDLTAFVKTWLENVSLPQDEMVKSLRKSKFIREYEMVDCDPYTSKCNDYLASDLSDKAKVKIVAQMPDRITNDNFANSWEVRQAIAQSVTNIPIELKKNYESLLKDPSYITIESTLYNLWVNFPEDRVNYLNLTKDVVGFSDYNVRLLWLGLHLNTLEYQPDKKEAVFEELKNYSSPHYGLELRMNAFKYIKLINGFDEGSIANLIEATNHHNWRFQQFSKELLGELSAHETYKKMIDNITIND